MASETESRFDDGDDLVRLLDGDGPTSSALDGDFEFDDLSDERVRSIYEDVKLVRIYDRKAVSLQRQGRIGTYPPLHGHEAVQVASVHALDEEDWLFPSYRENGAILARGVPPSRNLLAWRGHEAGNRTVEANVFPIANPVATHLPHAVGMAWAGVLDGEPIATLPHFGDGATSEGDFHEAMNFAGVFDALTVFFCNNNGWAISTPRENQTASETLAAKARAYGFEGVRVDGTDPLAVYCVTKAAIEKAKQPDEGESRPTLIEAVFYRLGAHSTSDDPRSYREESEVEEWRERDPVHKLEAFLLETGRLDEKAVEAIEAELREYVDEEVERAESYTEEPGAMFEHAYDEVPPRLEARRERLDSDQ